MPSKSLEPVMVEVGRLSFWKEGERKGRREGGRERGREILFMK